MKNLAHYGSYAVAALSWLAALNPGLVAAVAGPHAGAIAIPVIATAGGVLALLHQTGVIPGATPSATPPSAGTAAKMIPVLLMVGAALLTAGSLSACKTPPTAAQVANAQPYITAAVDIAVATAESKGVSAAQINSIAKVALAADAGTAATLSTVASVVNAQLAKLNLPAGDLAAAQILEVALEAAIQAKVGSNADVAAYQAAVATVLQSVIAATGG